LFFDRGRGVRTFVVKFEYQNQNKKMNKKIPMRIVVGIILMIAIVSGGFIWLYIKKPMTQNKIKALASKEQSQSQLTIIQKNLSDTTLDQAKIHANTAAFKSKLSEIKYGIVDCCDNPSNKLQTTGGNDICNPPLNKVYSNLPTADDMQLGTGGAVTYTVINNCSSKDPSIQVSITDANAINAACNARYLINSSDIFFIKDNIESLDTNKYNPYPDGC
jgi:hypothetical protein